MDWDKESFAHYDKAERNQMRRLLAKSPEIINLIAEDQVPLGSFESAELIDSLAAEIGSENEEQKEEAELEELKDDRYSLINLYGAVKKASAFLPLYRELGNLLRKYGLFDEEVVLLERAIASGGFSEADLGVIEQRLSVARGYREADDAAMTDSERTLENLRRALQKKPLDRQQIKELMEQSVDDAVLYNIACNTDPDPDMVYLRERAACLIRGRDYQYAFSSHLKYPARTAMILNLFDSLKGDDLFIARTILTDPKDDNKVHMLIYCQDEVLLMLGWLYVYGARKICADQLHAMGSRYPEAYEEMAPSERAAMAQHWLAVAAQTALDLLSEDDAVASRLASTASVDSEPLHFFLSFHHPRKAIRWWHARKLSNPARIAYVGSWTGDDQIKEALAVKINSPVIITDMLFGYLSGTDLVFGLQTPKDLTLQDRFCIEIMKNHPDQAIREHVRLECLRGKITIPGVDLNKPDVLFNE